LSAGRAEGCGNRGNPKLHRGRSLRDAVSGATRRLSAGLNGLMNGPSNVRVHPIETPETPVSGVFVVDDLTGNWRSIFQPERTMQETVEVGTSYQVGLPACLKPE
jgi:hypothetical protein